MRGFSVMNLIEGQIGWSVYNNIQPSRAPCQHLYLSSLSTSLLPWINIHTVYYIICTGVGKSKGNTL